MIVSAHWVADFTVCATFSAMILRQFPVKLAALLFSVTLSAAPVVGQRVPVGDPLEDYIRVLQAVGRADPAPLSIRPLSLDRVLRSIRTEAHPWQNRYSSTREDPQGVWYVLPEPEARAYWNSDHPVVRADGAVWQGKGGTFELAAVPTGASISAFGDPWYGGAIDRPQRFGDM